MTAPRLARRHRDNATFGGNLMSWCMSVLTAFYLASTLHAQEVRVRADGIIIAMGENVPNKIDRDTALAQVRGLVQNELRILARTCAPRSRNPAIC